MRFRHLDPKTVVIGTGWLIDTDTVITAAHNVYIPLEKSHATRVDVYIGYTSDEFSGPAVCEQRLAQTAGIHWGYYVTGQHMYDIAVLRLASPFRTAKPIPYKTTPIHIAQNTNLRVVGYPGDLPSKHDIGRAGCDMYLSQCPVGAFSLAENEYQLKYHLDTYGGRIEPNPGIRLDMIC
jgi:V8-like Glu-specific endopeptidase